MRTSILLFAAAVLTMNAFAQDWYHQRERRYSGDAWRAHLFLEVRTDLEHVWDVRAHQKERDRIAKTEAELTKMQADLDQTRWDNGLLNDVIDSIEKSSHDDRLARSDKDVLSDDLAKLRAFQKMHHKD